MTLVQAIYMRYHVIIVKMKFTQGKTPVGEHMHIDCCCSEHAFEIMNRFCSKKVFAPEDIVIFLDEDNDLLFALPFTWYEIQEQMEDYSDDSDDSEAPIVPLFSPDDFAKTCSANFTRMFRAERAHAKCVCGAATKLKRAGCCQEVWYCSTECAKNDWDAHKSACRGIKKPFEGAPLPTNITEAIRFVEKHLGDRRNIAVITIDTPDLSKIVDYSKIRWLPKSVHFNNEYEKKKRLSIRIPENYNIKIFNNSNVAKCHIILDTTMKH